MKRYFLIQLLKDLKLHPHFAKKIKIFAAVGIFGLVISMAILVWVGSSLFNYTRTSISSVTADPKLKNQVENFKSQVEKINFQPIGCWAKAQSLLAVQPWLTNPASDNLNNLIVACLGTAQNETLLQFNNDKALSI